MFAEAITEVITAAILQLCQDELQRLIQEMEAAPSRTAFSDVGTVAEVLVLTSGIVETKPLTRMLSDAAADWLKVGLMEDLAMTRAEFAYHIALLSYMARSSASWRQSDMEVIGNLARGGIIARNEIPVLRQHLIAAYFSQCGLHVDFGRLGRRDLAQIMDRRVLRARSDEFDLLGLLMSAQLLQLGHDSGSGKPRIYPQVLLVQAVRAANTNWLPVLTFLCQRSFGLPEPLRRTALKIIQESIPAEGQLLPAPPAHQIDNEFLERGERGLRLRSTIALAVSLTDMENFYGHK